MINIKFLSLSKSCTNISKTQNFNQTISLKNPYNKNHTGDEISAKNFYQLGARKFRNSTQEGKKCCQELIQSEMREIDTVPHEGGK